MNEDRKLRLTLILILIYGAALTIGLYGFSGSYSAIAGGLSALVSGAGFLITKNTGAFSWSAVSGPVGDAFEHAGIDRTLAFNLIVSSVILIALSYFGGKKFRNARPDDEPSDALTFSSVTETAVLALCDFSRGILGHFAEKFFWLTGGLFFFILTNNLLGLVPGFVPPTDDLNVTVTLGAVVFVVYQAVGIQIHGFHYIHHFLGPVWWLSWLILPIEIISHLVRPVSLALRLFGNMTGDHKVVEVFFRHFGHRSACDIHGIRINGVFFTGICIFPADYDISLRLC
ncbi:hypothetical protein CHS0354_018542 [Potamilus streckersoni]|uniref:ATP synthase subunit a n=1 Tax=Potamilus streckersoni TaxID=2493646 RepID=A0AAE0WA11_9BIVA|nr:hypothetical protein CHS0354_018542 [Potamilus streckersoni]